jgi:hypothetical protein
MRALAAAALLLGALATPAFAQEKAVEFVCSAPAGHTCQFGIKTAKGPVNFALPSGQKKVVEGVTPRADKYCVCDPGPVNETCTAPEVGKWCLGYWQDVVPGLNSRLEVGGFAVAGN